MKINFVLSIFFAITALLLLYFTFNENAVFTSGTDKNLAIGLTVAALIAAVFFGTRSNKKK